MDQFAMELALSVCFGLIGIVLLIFGFWIFDKVLTKIDFSEELKKNNIAVAVVIAGFMIAIGMIISGVVS
ncbi:MAG: DUF350 domain-containing protein [Clostridiaceae bacterium]|nr:DUF350 domain-containing protein [Clostridiaceae bacterium]